MYIYNNELRFHVAGHKFAKGFTKLKNMTQHQSKAVA